MIRNGCYLVVIDITTPFSPFKPKGFRGTLRIDGGRPIRTISGDWYRSVVTPDPLDGIPVFPIDKYAFHLTLGTILSLLPAPKWELRFHLRSYDSAAGAWTSGGNYRFRLHSASVVPRTVPSPKDCWEGFLTDAAHHVYGTVSLIWVSEHFRRASVEIDHAAQSEPAADDGGARNWSTVFADAGWKVESLDGGAPVAQAAGEFWNRSELHAAMLDNRAAVDLDKEWRFHLLCVRLINDSSAVPPDPIETEWGFMYDAEASDENDVPREGFALSSDWLIPDWLVGHPPGTRFGDYPEAYFRTALHEAGHAMSLAHVKTPLGLMTPSKEAAENASPPFPAGIVWKFAPIDRRKLRHASDLVLRPGGIPGALAGDRLAAIPGLQLKARPLLREVPLGAPVRIELELSHRGARPIEIPKRWTLGSGRLRGEVVGPDGVRRTFRPVLQPCGGSVTETLRPGESRPSAITLLRGREGALFFAPGRYRIKVRVALDSEASRRARGVIASTTVEVTAAKNEEHRKIAAAVLGTPEVLRTWAIGGDELKVGWRVIDLALRHRVLRPHFAYIKAKHRARPFFDRKPDYADAARILEDDSVVLSSAERLNAARILEASAGMFVPRAPGRRAPASIPADENGP